MNIGANMKFLIHILTVVILSVNLMGQGTGEIQGRVLDIDTREPIIGANVRILNSTLGAASDLTGSFLIRSVPLGTFAVQVDYIGYASRTISDIVVGPVRPARLEVELEEAVIELEAAVVVADFFTRSQDTPASTQVQSSEEIRRLPGGFEDVVRAISILPGVAQADGGRNDLIVRGGAPSENLYLIDNIEVPNINHFGTQGASGGPQSYVNLDYVDETSFSTGGVGVKYGDRLSSVLDISLGEGMQSAWGSKTTLSASQFGFNLEGPSGENGNFLFSARRSYLDFLFKAAGFGFVPEYWDFLAKASYPINGTDRLTILGIAALDNIKWFNETLEQRLDNSQILGSDQQQLVLGATYRHLMQSGFWTATLSRITVNYDFLQRDQDLQPIFSNLSQDAQTSLKMDAVWKLNRSTRLSSGAKVTRMGFSTDLELNLAGAPGMEMGILKQNLATTDWKIGTYVQLAKRTQRFESSIGVRLDQNTLLEAAGSISPRASLGYRISGDLTATVNLGRYHQDPSTIWLVANPANRALKPIRADQVVLGLEYLWRADTRLTLETYAKRYTDYPASITRPWLVMVNTGAGFGGSTEGFASFGVDPLVSEGSGMARGIELFLQKKMSEVPCYGTFSISYNRTRFQGLDGMERPGSFDQTWITNLGGGYILNERWEFSTKFRYATGRPYTPLDDSGQAITSRTNAVRLDASHSLDVRADRRWAFGGWGLITYLDIQNIYNNKPASIPRVDPKTGEITDDPALGILPSVGISAEF